MSAREIRTIRVPRSYMAIRSDRPTIRLDSSRSLTVLSGGRFTSRSERTR